MGGAHIVVAGAGGNTGSHLLPHLARLSTVSTLTLVDPDCYEEKNLAVQNIDATDIGLSKVAAQMARLARIREDLSLVPICARVEDIPRGLLRCDLIVSCLDSRIARQRLNEIAWRLGIPWIDCGVLGGQNLVRINRWPATVDAPCLECAWDKGDYAMLEQEYLCGGGQNITYPTMSSSALGSLAGSLVALEIDGRMRVGWENARQVIYDAEHHAVHATVERRRADCRFDHHTWEIEPWFASPETTTIGDALGEVGVLRIEGHRFVAAMICPACGRRENAGLRLNRPLARCSACHGRMAPCDFSGPESLSGVQPAKYLKLTLAEAGLRVGDLISSGSRHRQIAEPA